MDPKALPKLVKVAALSSVPEVVAKTVTTSTVIRNGETKKVGDWKIEAILMYNLKRGPAESKLFHDNSRGNGYVLTYGGSDLHFRRHRGHSGNER